MDNVLFIVTSALNADMGVVSRTDRFDQTIKGLISIRKYVPDAIIILADGSPHKLEEEKLKAIAHFANYAADFSNDAQISELAVNHRKSEAENLLLLKTLMLLQQDDSMKDMLSHVGRIFKISGRTDLTDGFDVEEHMVEGKYVFKKAIPSWLPPEKKRQITDHLYITRMYSFCPSLLDDYIGSLQSIYNTVVTTGVDTEHAHYKEIDANLVIAKETLHCDGIIAGTGKVEQY